VVYKTATVVDKYAAVVARNERRRPVNHSCASKISVARSTRLGIYSTHGQEPSCLVTGAAVRFTRRRTAPREYDAGRTIRERADSCRGALV